MSHNYDYKNFYLAPPRSFLNGVNYFSKFQRREGQDYVIYLGQFIKMFRAITNFFTQ
jgi:hypothetical protein